MSYTKKVFNFISIRRDDFVNFLLTGKLDSFPADDNGLIEHLVIKGVYDYEVVEKEFSLRTTVTFKGRDFPAIMMGRVSSHYVRGKIHFTAR